MNEMISLTRADVLEIRNFERSDVPLAFYHGLKKRGSIFLVNKHADIELLFVTDGKLKIHLDADTFYAERDDVVVVNPNVLHNIIPLTDTVHYECIIIDRNFFERIGMPLERVYVQEVIRDACLFEHIYGIQENLITNKTGYYAARTYALLIDLALMLFEKYAREKAENQTVRTGLRMIETSIAYINKHIRDSITVEDIANHIGYSKFYFCRRFKEITGHTVATYINMQKIKYAQRMLQETDGNINEIAFRCGFKSVAYFSTTFKKYTGISPSQVKGD